MVATVPAEAKLAVPDPSRALEGGSAAGGRPVGERPPPSFCRPPTRTPGRGSRLVFRACAGSLPELPRSPGCSNGWGAQPCRVRLAVQPSRPGRRGDGPSTRGGGSGARAPPGPQRPTTGCPRASVRAAEAARGCPGRRTCPPVAHGNATGHATTRGSPPLIRARRARGARTPPVLLPHLPLSGRIRAGSGRGP